MHLLVSHFYVILPGFDVYSRFVQCSAEIVYYFIVKF